MSQGLVARPTTWAELCQVIAEERFEELGRLESQLAVYRAWRADTLQEYASVTDNLVHRIFGHRLETNDSGLRVAVQPEAEPGKDRDSTALVWRENDFPYALEAGVRHFVVWSEGAPLSEATIQAQIAANLPAGAASSCVWFQNPVALQSVRDIEHVHVFHREHS